VAGVLATKTAPNGTSLVPGQLQKIIIIYILYKSKYLNIILMYLCYNVDAVTDFRTMKDFVTYDTDVRQVQQLYQFLIINFTSKVLVLFSWLNVTDLGTECILSQTYSISGSNAKTSCFKRKFFLIRAVK
jgi:hypothetical protein